ncbi:hypothetical protein TNCT_78041 [Trichonephila clavata]|uniref:Uncharacterized protein n=1 Tax=Trichonephila clavata TaxID=2740835 RepID=A0A8X6JJ01_TRICU|nr:hypothetical protein TNCT_78041 [Trichonephila clavata]
MDLYIIIVQFKTCLTNFNGNLGRCVLISTQPTVTDRIYFGQDFSTPRFEDGEAPAECIFTSEAHSDRIFASIVRKVHKLYSRMLKQTVEYSQSDYR